MLEVSVFVSHRLLAYNVQVKCRYCTCADVVADALHGDDRIRYPAALQVPHHASDPTMHLCLQKKSTTHSVMCESCPKFTPVNIRFIIQPIVKCTM